ncbi:SRPBCC domain-containing protein [Galactobacter caseinivorans]|nr:SRPBCC domain-containing protein [Galactobacter caseinivorans]
MTETSADPVIARVRVPVGPVAAEAGWVHHIGEWWPLDTHGVHGGTATVVFAGGEIHEKAPDGSVAYWGTVTTRESGERLVFTWHPGRSKDEATLVSLTFASLPEGGTDVLLEHSGFDSLPDGGAVRTKYAAGWPGVLERYAAFMAARD